MISRRLPKLKRDRRSRAGVKYLAGMCYPSCSTHYGWGDRFGCKKDTDKCPSNGSHGSGAVILLQRAERSQRLESESQRYVCDWGKRPGQVTGCLQNAVPLALS